MILKKSHLPTITLAKEQIHNHISQTKNHSFFPNQKKIIKFQSPIHFRLKILISLQSPSRKPTISDLLLKKP